MFFQYYSSTLLPKYNQTDTAYTFKYNIAGTRKEDISLDIENNYLMVKVKDRLYFKDDIATLEYDSENIKAKYMDGILEVTIPKSKSSKPSNIKIE